MLLEPLEQESLLKNLQLRYEKNEIYVSACGCPDCGCGCAAEGVRLRTSCSCSPTPHFLHLLPWLQTYIGSVLVSVNPYQQLPIYGPEFIDKYRDYTFYELKPHM